MYANANVFFSSLKCIKTFLRDSTGQERLNGLALIKIECDYQIDIDQVVKEFVDKNEGGKIIF